MGKNVGCVKAKAFTNANYAKGNQQLNGLLCMILL